jgi:hypothetical protein
MLIVMIYAGDKGIIGRREAAIVPVAAGCSPASGTRKTRRHWTTASCSSRTGAVMVEPPRFSGLLVETVIPGRAQVVRAEEVSEALG